MARHSETINKWKMEKQENRGEKGSEIIERLNQISEEEEKKCQQ